MRCISGLTEAGMGSKGIVASSAGMGVLLQQGIGDTIRVSLTPDPMATARWRSRSRRNCCRPWAFSHLRAAGGGVSGLRVHHLDHVSGAGA